MTTGPDPPDRVVADSRGHHLRLSAEEFDGDLPLLCARTGAHDAQPTPVWFARSPWVAWAPLSLLAVWAAVSTSWSPLLSWWAAGSLFVPLLVSRGVSGRIPLSADLRGRRANLRRRRLVMMLSALLLSWLAVGLWLIDARIGGLLVLAAVLSLYALAVGMFLLGRLIMVGGWPEADGGVTLTRVHSDFVTAVELRRTGHRP